MVLPSFHKGPKVPATLHQGCPKVPTALLQGSHKVPTTLLQVPRSFPQLCPLCFKVPTRFPQLFCKVRFPQLCPTRIPRCPQHRSTTLPHKVLPRFPQLCSKVPTRFPQRGPEVPTRLAQVSHKVPARFLIDSQGNVIIPQPTVTFYLANLLVSYPLSFLLFFIRAPNPLSGPESSFGARIHSQGHLMIFQVYFIVLFLLLPFALLTF